MPVPQAVVDQGTNYHLVTTVTKSFDAPRAGASGAVRRVTKHFHCYLELYFQAKHSQLIRGYCDGKGIDRRRDTGEMCVENQTAPVALSAGGFYGARSATAADIVYHHMRRKWGGAQGAGPIIGLGPHHCAAQAIVQPDGYQYEVSYYYDVDAYLFYHVYPSR